MMMMIKGMLANGSLTFLSPYWVECIFIIVVQVMRLFDDNIFLSIVVSMAWITFTSRRLNTVSAQRRIWNGKK